MRVLLDENFPVPLLREFKSHDCSHVILLGWAGTRNGELLARAEAAGFQVLITFDDGLPKENDISRLGLSVYILQPQGQGVRSARALVGEVLVALEDWHPGEVLTFSNRTGKRP